MGLFDNFPYTNFHELNLMWILEALKEIQTTTEQFVAINSLKYADPIQWNIVQQYEKNTIVIDPLTGTAYISVQPVPSGVALTNTDYWTVVFDLGSFVTRAAKNFTNRWEEATTLTATFPTNAGEWLVWGDTLYVANVNITAGDSYVIDGNIRRITVEEVKNEIYTTFNNMIGDLADLSTTDKSNLVAAINEVLNTLVNTSGDLADLSTTDKSNLVAAINEVITTFNDIIGDLDALNTRDKSSIVNAINSIMPVTPYRLIMPHLANVAGNDITLQVIELDNEFIAIDSGIVSHSSTVDSYLTSLLGNKKLKAYFITHFHSDHTGGSVDIINNHCNSDTLFVLPMNADISQFSTASDILPMYNAVMNALNGHNYNYIIPNEGDTISIFDGAMSVDCYNYNSNNLAAYYATDDYNNCSASFRFYTDAGSLYCSGDTGIEAQELIADIIKHADVALIPHHNVNFCGSLRYHNNINPDIWISSHQTATSSFPRYINKAMLEYLGLKPAYDISNDIDVLISGEISINGGGVIDVVTTTNNYRLLQTYPYANDMTHIIKDYTLFKNWSLDELCQMSYADPKKRSFILFDSSAYTAYYQQIITDLVGLLGGSSWIITLGGGILEAHRYGGNDTGRRILKECSALTGPVSTYYLSLNGFGSKNKITLNLSGGGSTATVTSLLDQPALLGCTVTTGGGSTEVLCYNTERGSTYHGYAHYGSDLVYVNFSISGTTLTLNACKYNGVDTTLEEIHPIW